MKLQVFLQTVNEYCHVVNASTPADLRRAVWAQYPDVALIDWELPSWEMDQLLADLRTACPHLIVITLHPESMMTGAPDRSFHEARHVPV